MATKQGKSAEQRGFEAIGRFSETGGKPFRPFMDRLFSRRVTSAHLNRDWASDADWARMQQDPLRARAFLYTVLLAVAALLVWSYFAAIDEVTRGAGRVIPSSQLQRVQTFDGGVVQEIPVR
ncbi:MAG: HlyD family type I secretion periplasmic adaptor subunit, partial [Halomonas sp.]